MTLEEIALIEFNESNAGLILSRILDLSVLSEGELLFSIDEDETKSFYERIIFNPKVILPSEERIAEEVAEYKAELTVIENARLAEIARIEDIKSRFAAIPDIRGVLNGNPAKELERIIAENDQAKMTEIEVSSVEFESEQALKNAEAQADAIAEGLVNLCLGCVKIIIKHNIANGLNKDQKDQQAVDYANVFSALNGYRPGKFKSAVTAITPDGTIVKENLKEELLSFLTENGV